MVKALDHRPIWRYRSVMDYEEVTRFIVMAREVLERLDGRVRWIEIILSFLCGAVLVLCLFAFLAWRALEGAGVRVAW